MSTAKTGLAERFLPSTFEERGTAVPFTTPLLAYARVRKDYRDRIELCVGRFTDAAGFYVIPWASVRDIASLTVHDVLLHEEVVSRKALDPYAMRLAALNVAASGLAGPEAAEAAAKVLSEDEELKALNQVVLMVKVIEQVESAATPALLRAITTAEGQAKVREVLFGIADRLDMSAEIFDRRLSELGVGTYTVGVPWSPAEGPMRRTLKRVGDLRAALLGWASVRLNDAADTAKFCAEVAELTFTVATTVLAELDGIIADPHGVVVAWEEKYKQIEHLARRLAWLLDGWNALADWWFDAESKPEEEQSAVLLDIILPVLPLVPREELQGSKRVQVAGLVERSRRWVRMNEDWLTGEVDLDMVERLEHLKAQAA